MLHFLDCFKIDVVSIFSFLKSHWAGGKKWKGGNTKIVRLIDFVPPPRNTVLRYTVFKESLPVPLHACHIWDFMVEDQRRLDKGSFFGSGAKKDVVTGVWVYCKLATEGRNAREDGMKVQFMVEKLSEGAADIVDEVDDLPDPTPQRFNGDWGFEVKEIDGWRCSFMKKEAEQK